MPQKEETRLLLDSMNRLFEERSTKDVIDRAEAGAFPTELWRAVAETGVPLAAVPESAGGIGAEWIDILPALRVAGRHAAPIPLAETMIAAWLAAEAGLEAADGPMSFGPVRREDRLSVERDGAGWRLSGTATRVPWGRQAERLVLLAEGPGGEMAVALDGTNSVAVTPGKNLAGEPRDTLRFEGVQVSGDAVAPVKPGVDRAEAYRRGAVARALLMSGAMERALEIALAYVPERKQFGRPISKFQAVQQNMAVLAGQVAAAGAAADGGAEALAHPDPELRELLIAIAKTRCGAAATLAAELAHQVHGAIGFTQEYALQLSTRRLWSWRDEFGADTEWAAVIGRIACARGADALWPTLTEA